MPALRSLAAGSFLWVEMAAGHSDPCISLDESPPLCSTAACNLPLMKELVFEVLMNQRGALDLSICTPALRNFPALGHYTARRRGCTEGLLRSVLNPS
jgi:hypothetical protein